MIKLTFKKIASYPDETHYESDVIATTRDKGVANSKAHAWGKLTVQGDKLWVYARFSLQVRWPTDPKSWFGHELSRHFWGVRSRQEAEDWLNFLATYPPRYSEKTEGLANAPDMKGGQHATL
ncbi:MAG TPA: hypothetical protein ACFYD4_07560 [Candidatus Wunengus sp. YC61]|uniref:hypothetical protein n=1 Tax=Candidatus Wunengus sp. YC61 TaxID=3367698 RepID=UPI00402A16B8